MLFCINRLKQLSPLAKATLKWSPFMHNWVFKYSQIFSVHGVYSLTRTKKTFYWSCPYWKVFRKFDSAVWVKESYPLIEALQVVKKNCLLFCWNMWCLTEKRKTELFISKLFISKILNISVSPQFLNHYAFRSDLDLWLLYLEVTVQLRRLQRHKAKWSVWFKNEEPQSNSLKGIIGSGHESPKHKPWCMVPLSMVSTAALTSTLNQH